MENGSSDAPKSGSSTGRSSTNHLYTRFIYRPFLAPIKIFRCKYCQRKFLNSRALGGHQNAHKKERTLWMMGFSNHKSMVMESLALPYNPIRQISRTGKPKESFKRFQEAMRQQTSVAAVDQEPSWPRSFHVNSTEGDSSHGEVPNLELIGSSLTDLVLSSQEPDQPKICSVDLDLHL